MPPSRSPGRRSARRFVSLGGTRVRVHLSNAEGTGPLHVGGAHVAIRRQGASILRESDRALTFGGTAEVTIAPGASAVSDPVTLAVASSSTLAVSLYLREAVAATTEHGLGETTYVSDVGDRTAAATFEGAKGVNSWYFVTGIDVDGGPDARAIVALGDSLTDGFGSTDDAHHRWTDFLADRLNASERTAPRAVVNAGISGNCLLRTLVGRSALDRLDGDVLDRAGAAWVIVLEGTNDIGATPGPGQSQPTVNQIVAGYQQIIRRGHARGLKVLGATLPPSKEWPSPGSPRHRQGRRNARRSIAGSARAGLTTA